MPAQVVVVHESDAQSIAGAIAALGYTAQAYTDPLHAMASLEQARQIELLITSVRFGAGRSNGRSLALMVGQKRPSVRLLFLCAPEDREHVAGLGECLPVTADAGEIAAFAQSLLQGSAPS